MKYYFSKTISKAFEETVRLITTELKNKGFGVICEIRLHEKLKENLEVDFKKYTILEACHPAFSLKALLMEDKIGTMLPCNLLVIERGDGSTEVAAINPVASMQTKTNSELYDVVHKISRTLKSIVEHA